MFRNVSRAAKLFIVLSKRWCQRSVKIFSTQESEQIDSGAAEDYEVVLSSPTFETLLVSHARRWFYNHKKDPHAIFLYMIGMKWLCDSKDS